MLTLKIPGRFDTPSNNNQFFTIHSKKFPVLGVYPFSDDSSFLDSETGIIGKDQGKIMFFGDSSCMEYADKGSCLGVIDVFVDFLRR